MKKFLLIAFVSLFAIAVNAQSTSPRFGTTKNDDNTGRALTWGKYSVTDASGVDTVKIYPRYYSNLVAVTAATDTVSINAIVTGCYQGDKMDVLITGASGKRVKFVGSNWVSAGAATLSSGGKAVVSYIFDGSKWVESNRVVQ